MAGGPTKLTEELITDAEEDWRVSARFLEETFPEEFALRVRCADEETLDNGSSRISTAKGWRK